MELFRRNDAKSIRKAACGFSVPYALALVCGRAMEKTNSLSGVFSSGRGILLFAGKLLLVFAVTFAAVYAATALILSRRPSESRELKRPFLWMWPLIFLCWLPCYLAYYPGVFSYDIITQTAMIMENSITAAIPPLHTLLWKIFLTLDHATKSRIVAIVWYSLFQMLSFSAMLAGTASYAGRLSRSAGWGVFAALFFALNPVVALMSFMTTKAVLFSGCFAMACVRLWDLARDPEAFFVSRKKCAGLGLWILLAVLLRSNAVFCFLLTLPAVLLYFKTYRKKALAVISVPIALYFLISTVGYDLLGYPGVGKNELLCIPFQQIGCVVSRHGDELPQEDTDVLAQFIAPEELAELYNPRFSDPVKNVFTVPGSLAADFVRLWVRLGLRWPADYIDAFLTLNLPYWYPLADPVDEFSQREYIETSDGGYGYYWVTQSPKLPALKRFYDRVADYSLFRGIPVIRELFSIATPVWVTAFCLAALTAARRRREKLLLLPSLFEWLIFIFGPVSNLRYIFPVMLLFPVFLAAVFRSDFQKK